MPTPQSAWAARSFGDVDAVAGIECVVLEQGWIRVYDAESGANLAAFFVGDDQVRMQLVSGS